MNRNPMWPTEKAATKQAGLDNPWDEEDSGDRSEVDDVDIEQRQQALDELTEQAQDLDMGY